MTIANRRTPERNSPLLSGPLFEKGVAVSNVLTTGGGVETMTVAELLSKFLVVDCQDAQSWTLPTAALLNAGIPGVEVGQAFEFTIVNYGDATMTLALGTGITKTTIATVAAILTIATLTGKRFRLECTGVANPYDPTTSDSWVIWTVGAFTAVA
jgi:hypothetical protein